MIDLKENEYKETTKLLTRNYRDLRRCYACSTCPLGLHNPTRPRCRDAQEFTKLLMEGLQCVEVPTYLMRINLLNETKDIRKIIIRIIKYATMTNRTDVREAVEIVTNLLR